MKHDVIVFFQYGKSDTFPQNYHLILLLAMSKIAERIVGCRIQQHTEELDILPAKQFGFRYQHSSQGQMLRLLQYCFDG